MIEELFSMGEAPASVVKEEIHGDDETPVDVTYKRDRFAEHAGGANHLKNWPIECFASGVNAAQAPELRKFFKDKKFDCEVSVNGDPIYTSHEHRRKALKLRGFCDHAGF